MVDFKILEWLGIDERGLGYYLHFLNLRYTAYPAALERLRTEVIPRLEREPDYWREVVEGPIWRPQLVDCYALLLSHDIGYLSALAASFEHHSFVCPQVAVAFGLLHPVEARSYFENYLRGPAVTEDAKMTGAAHRVLVELGSPAAQAFDIKGFDANPPPGASVSHWHMDCAVGQGVVKAHWEAWKKILAAGASG